MKRPPFIVSTRDVPEDVGKYPGSDEELAHGRAIGKAAGLEKIGLHVERLPPGRRLSYPHAEADEEEFVYVLEGELDVWIDGHRHRVRAGDLVAFPCGTGISHTFINDGDVEVTMLVGGEKSRKESRIFYPLNPERRAQVGEAVWWHDEPARDQGDDPGIPRRGTPK
jgi:uncharacterized cupin superfamily protein